MEQDASRSKRAIQCVVVTPEATVLESSAEFIALPLPDGEIGIAPLHSPMIGRLGYGEMRLVEGGKARRFYVDGGFVQVADNVVSVLTNRALPAEEIDADQASERLAESQKRPAAGDEMLAIRERQVTQARAQLRVAQRAK